MSAAPLVVIKPGALGDTLLLAPALRALRAARPDLSVRIIGTPPYMELLALLGVADEFHSLERFDLYLPKGRGAALVTGAVVLALVRHAPRPGEPDPLLARGAVQTLWRPSRPESGQGHAVLHLDGCLRQLLPHDVALRQDAFEIHPQAMTSFPRPYVVLAPGAGSPAKRLPLQRFIAIAQQHATSGIRPVWIVGPAELEEGLTQRLPQDHTCLQAPALTEAAHLLAGARAVWANDSGLAHLAALVGAPTTVFFGPTDPAIWLPWGPQVRIERF